MSSLLRLSKCIDRIGAKRYVCGMSFTKLVKKLQEFLIYFWFFPLSGKQMAQNYKQI